MANKIICNFCAGEFDEMEPKCPYCGSMNYKGAEAEYFDKLENVRGNMEGLEQVPGEETKKEFRKQGKFLKKVFLILFVIIAIFAGLYFWSEARYQRDDKKDFLWRQEHYPIFDDLYEAGDYDEILRLMTEDYEGEPVWEWEHAEFIELYDSALKMKDILREEQNAGKLSKIACGLLLSYEWDMMSIPFCDLEEQECEFLAEYEEIARDDLETRWNMSEEDYNMFYQQLVDYGWVSYLDCEDYVDQWYSKQ
uniref:hypothetical protein n=1 Tax=Acetatifactor sp. TaxID=1872090 RepID=UPI0040560CE8